MRFKVGSFVEVLINDNLPSGSWRCAEVVSRNDFDYIVKYKFDTCILKEALVERVSKKSIRPLPPLVELSGNWDKGDVLEVFQNFVWKMATVCKALGTNDFLVRLVGFSREFKVFRSELRVRQSWQDGNWFVIGKNIGNFKEGECRERLRNQNPQLSSQITRAERKISPYDEFYNAKNHLESPTFALKNRKRRISYADSEVEVPVETTRKFRVIEMKGGRYCLREKVVNSLNNSKTQFTNLLIEKKNVDRQAVGRSCEIRLNQNDEDSIACSVGSCSITSNDFFKSCSYCFKESIDAECSDAESVCYGDLDEKVNVLPTKREFVDEIRRLELNAYRCTMEALHACGPLSWEQETMVTNLRLSLNISNDEHLMELRNLASSATSLSFR